MKKILTIAALATVLAACQNKDQQGLTFKVNDNVSKAEWKGSAPDHNHVGSFKVTGMVETGKDGIVKSGDFVIPIASIEDYDLKDPVKQALLTDLKDNFFKLAVNPNAQFHIVNVSPLNATYVDTLTGALKGTNYMLEGDFTMLGQTHSVTFPAKITTVGDSLITEAKFNIDRNKWGMHNYNDPKKSLYILPEVDIHLMVKAQTVKPTPLAYIGIYW